MTLSLCYDFETTDLIGRGRSNHPDQPHIVQMAALLMDDDGTVLKCHDVLVRPEGWTSCPAAQATHKIPLERLMDEGIPERDAAERLLSVAERANLRVGHQEAFDARIMRIALLRYFDHGTADRWAAGPPAYCTMKACQGRYGLPNTFSSNAKVYRTLFGEDLPGGHDALFDVFATRRIFLELRRREQELAARAEVPVLEEWSGSRVFLREIAPPPAHMVPPADQFRPLQLIPER